MTRFVPSRYFASSKSVRSSESLKRFQDTVLSTRRVRAVRVELRRRAGRAERPMEAATAIKIFGGQPTRNAGTLRQEPREARGPALPIRPRPEEGRVIRRKTCGGTKTK